MKQFINQVTNERGKMKKVVQLFVLCMAAALIFNFYGCTVGEENKGTGEAGTETETDTETETEPKTETETKIETETKTETKKVEVKKEVKKAEVKPAALHVV